MKTLNPFPILLRVLCILAVSFFSSHLHADLPKAIVLWPQGAPGSEGKNLPEVGKPEGPEINWTTLTGVHHPSMLPYIPQKDSESARAAVIILPGGGHKNLAIGHEGYNVGQWMAEHGICGFVLKYRLAKEPGSTYKIEGEALADTQRAIRIVRSRAKEWNIDPNKIGVMGFSAGGELASLASIKMDGGIENSADPIDKESAKPNFQALIYPGQSGKINPEKGNPPAFLACGNMDRPDISEGLADVYLRMKKAGVPVELHIYANTGHGFGLRATNTKPSGEWPVHFQQWLTALNPPNLQAGK